MSSQIARKPTLAIFNMAGEGHHPRYIRWILESPLSRDFEFVVLGSPLLFVHSELLECQVPFEAVPIDLTDQEAVLFRQTSTSALLRREFYVRSKYQKALNDLTRTRRVDVALVPFVDDCMNAIAIAGSPFGSVPWVGLTMRLQFHFNRVGVIAPAPRFAPLRKALYHAFLRARSLSSLLTIDPTLIDYAVAFEPATLNKLAYVPDPCEPYELPSRSEAREALNIPAEATLVLAYGALTERKGLFELLTAAAHPDCPQRVHVLLAGKQYQDVQDFLAGPVGDTLRAQGRLHVIPGYIPSSLESTLLAAADWMWVAYKDFYMMSSVLVMAARHSVPVIASTQGVVGYLGRKHRLGTEADANSIPSVLAALQRAQHDPSLSDVADRGRIAFADHSVAVFQQRFTDAIEKALGSSAKR